MPSISTMAYPIPAYVRVEVNWADVTQAVAAKVERVDCETGERTPLRPYVSYNGDYLTLSCGYGIFWDTEAPLDRCFYYCTSAIDAAGAVVTTAKDPIITDTFSRTVGAGSWGTADTGQAWTIVSGTATDFSVTGTRGRMGVTTVNQIHRAVIDGPLLNVGSLVTFIPNVLATGASIDMNTLLRRDEVSNSDYRIIVRFNTTGLVDLIMGRVVNGGAFVALGTVNSVLAYTATTQVQARFEVWGSLIRSRIWDSTTPEPGAWTISVTDATPYVTPAAVGLRSLLNAGNTNTLPVNLEYDNFFIYDPCVSTVTVENCSDDMILGSSGQFRLGDPVRPCNDVILDLTGEVDPECVPTQGIFFGNMSEEVAASNTGNLLPVNGVYPIVVNRNRRSLAATLTVATRTFADRDDLRDLDAPGSPLFLRGPAQYGIKDRYMSVGDVTETRPLSDHKIQPRVVSLPHAVVKRPSGPTQGVCGARVDDLCDIYTTWTALDASGLTWADLLRGKASNDTPIPDTVERNWNDVNATYADWNAVNAGNTDWDDLLDGA